MRPAESATTRLLRAVFLPASMAILALAALLVPLPFYLEVPGTPVSLEEAVAIQQDTPARLEGDFLLTTISLRSGTAVRAVRGLVDEDAELVPSSLVVPPGEGQREYFERQRDVFRASVDVAGAVALAAAGFDVDPTAITGEGAAVGRVLDGAPAQGVLAPGDIITEVDGAPVRVVDDLRELLDAAGEGELQLRFRRDDEVLTASITPAEVPTPSGAIRGIGVEIQTASPRIDLPIGVEVDSGAIGGPSAGLMLALTIYDKAAEEDLAAGRVVAGTGTLSPEGQVGPIGGIGQKVVAAHGVGADLFISPAEQLDTARAAVPSGSSLRVIGAATFDEALAALQGELDERAAPVGPATMGDPPWSAPGGWMVRSRATPHREPGQGRKAAAISGPRRVPRSSRTIPRPVVSTAVAVPLLLS